MLSLSNISKSYGTRTVLDDISLDVHPGELLGYVGANGAGKTTSMRVALGITRPDRGHVSLHGRAIDEDLRSRIGYMPEERGLFPTMPIDRQLQFFAELRGVAPRQIASVAAYWLDRFGLSERSSQRLENLSLGNQQRVQLAAALVHAPDLLVLDEPFSGLDPLAVDIMTEVLREEASRGVPVIFSSHQLELVERVCDRVAILQAGRIVACGTVDELTGAGGDRHLLRSTLEPEHLETLLSRVLGRRDVLDREFTDVHGDGVAVLTLAPAELQQVVDSVRDVGQIWELRPWRPTLTDVFRETVTPQTHA